MNSEGDTECKGQSLNDYHFVRVICILCSTIQN